MSATISPDESSTELITIDYLRYYSALQGRPDKQLQIIVETLKSEWIETLADLNRVSRNSLKDKLPALALDALKPYFSEDEKLSDIAPAGTTSDNPLIVVAKAQQQNSTILNDTTAHDQDMEVIVTNWKAKRERDCSAEDESLEKKRRVQEISPTEDSCWYLGSTGEPFYLRPCVEDLVKIVLGDMNNPLLADKPIVYIISGASGIGKSWSINAFVTELLLREKKVFFHSGASGLAWKITNNDPAVPVDPSDIETRTYDEWVYVYDSPGSKSAQIKHSRAKLRLNRGVSLIFSSPKASNYAYALSKSNGYSVVVNLPTWKKSEILNVVALKSFSSAVDACYGIWGGNMRACQTFLQGYKIDPKTAETQARSELDAQIKRIDKGFADKMAKTLEKQDVEGTLNAEDIKDSPGHILVPQPAVPDPKAKGDFTRFFWRFCSPLAELKFWDHVKEMDKDVVMGLLKRVFQVPSPKGVLCEKVSHFLITNGAVRHFRSHTYNSKEEERIVFPQCKVEHFETKSLKDALEKAIKALREGGSGAIALEPEDTSFDAADMFVLVKKATDAETARTVDGWFLYLLQDTIARNHSLHPVKVLWYCALFCDAFNKVFSEASTDCKLLLDCCKYVPVVPQEEKKIKFVKPVSNSTWNEIDRVAKLLDLSLPDTFSKPNPDWENCVQRLQLEIPPLASGKQRALSKTVVGNALLLRPAQEKVIQQCQVIFDVLNS